MSASELRRDSLTRAIVSQAGTDGGQDIFFAAVALTRMPMAVADVRLPDMPIVFANDAFVRMCGYAREEIVGRNCRFLQGPDTDRDTVADIRRAVAGELDIATEILNYRKDGTSFWNALFLCPIHDAQGAIRYYFGSQLDVSRRRDAEEALRQAQKMEAVGQLTGGLAHDFNNLLTVVAGQVEIALDRMEDDRGRRALRRALDATERGARLTQQLLAFARKQQLHGRATSLNQLVSSLTELLERTLGAAIDIRTALADGLPPCRVDPVQAESALLNVLINARDAMPTGGEVTIGTEAADVTGLEGGGLAGLAPGPYAVLRVSDTGMGMPPAVLAHAAEPFFTTKDVGRGSGMGLAMVYGFVRQSHGAVTIDSEPGRGTTVRMWFPATADEAPEAPARAAQPRMGGSETVLVVDDNLDVLELARDTLGGLGYRLIAADCAEAALAVLRGDAPVDLLFTDVVMPGGMNGVSLAREARRLRPGIAVLLTTGFAEPTGADSRATGDFESIDKPYRRTALAAKVRAVLGRRTAKT